MVILCEEIWSYCVRGHRATFDPGKVDIVAISNPFVDLSYMVFVFRYDSTYSKLNNTAKTGRRKATLSGDYLHLLAGRAC